MTPISTPDELPVGAEKVALVHAMFDAIAPRYDLVNRLMTFGLDRGWRRQAIAALGLRPGARVLDLACGTGDLARESRRAGHRSIGADLSLGMLVAARAGGAPLLEADAVAMPLADSSLDGITSGFALRNFADLTAVMSEAARTLRPGGRLVLLEVDTPRNGLLRLGHRVWLQLAVPRIGALLSEAAPYRYLPRSLAYLPGFEELTGLLERAGFGGTMKRPLCGGIAQLVVATRTADR